MYDLIRFVIPRIAAEWEDVAYMLKYNIPTVESISEKQCNDPQKCCRELFMDWLTTSNGIAPKTWSTLLQKIRQLTNLIAAVEGIKRELMSIYGTYTVLPLSFCSWLSL